MLGRLSQLMQREKIVHGEIIEAVDILNTFYVIQQ
jgi:hypothetical protein